jgi:hypothetical protein
MTARVLGSAVFIANLKSGSTLTVAPDLGSFKFRCTKLPLASLFVEVDKRKLVHNRP